MRIKLVGMLIHDFQGGFVAHMVLCKIMYVAELILGGFVRQEVSTSVQCVVQTRCEKKFYNRKSTICVQRCQDESSE